MTPIDPISGAILVPALSEAAKQLVKPLYDKFLLPQLDKIVEWNEERGIKNDISVFESKCLNFVNRTYNKCVILNTIVFPNEKVNIHSLYQNLTISTNDNKESYCVNDNVMLFSENHKRIIISDSAGMGKSTLMKWIVVKCIESNIIIPVFVELRKLSAVNNIINEILSQFNDIDKKIDEKFLLKLLELGKFVIVLDGYDEIDLNNQTAIIRDVIDFTYKASNNIFIMTSRPEPSLASFGDFKLFRINPLVESDYKSLIQKCDYISNLNNYNNLINDISKHKQQISEFLTNPFLVTLLYKTYIYNKNIPLKKSSFYDEIYTALYKYHDLSKDRYERTKKSGLDIYNFRIVLRYLAFETTKLGRVEYTNVEMYQLVNKVRNLVMGIPSFLESNFIEDIIQHVPIFMREGNSVKWSHKSFQDYFMAEYIMASDNKSAITNQMYNSSNSMKYSNIIDVYSELDYNCFRNTIVYNVISDFIDFADSKKGEFAKYNKNSIDTRLTISFAEDRLIYFDKDKIYANENNPVQLEFSSRNSAQKIYNGWGWSSPNNMYIGSARKGIAKNIVDLLYAKKLENIFEHEAYNGYRQNSLFIINNKIYDLNQSDECSQEQFDEINNLIPRQHPYVISYEKCVSVKRDIENRISAGSQNLIDF